ncbi:MAG TPA: serine/threonine-protein kinase [Pyrinomonadaceae bacterium]|nr:serine/threonine-protein kinase [Pyrinomonadaceae bacterium]
MSPERWQQISRIFKSAISLDGEARAAYVANQCGTDSSLRSEVEKLLAFHQRAGDENFIGGRAADDGAVLLVENVELKPRLEKGRQLGSYLILDQLGAGGMGEVYLAKDSRLERTVALKVLSPDIAEDKRRMQRFRQEAKVASSLNQPNILTIFEFGEVDGLTFLATEFIDGETLRHSLHDHRLKLDETIDIAIQVLTALEAAHEARIVHRDIKPENVMIRHRDRLVKVLDFGLAKVTETGARVDTEAATEFKTTPGVLMGTINYMSPEQARALAVDERTDIWSVGVMLYEMVTGVMPFGGPTSSHTLVQIIEQEPPPLVKDAPVELQRIIRKAMAKSPNERYQSAKDMAEDLKNLRKQLDHGEVLATDHTDNTDHTKEKKRVLFVALVAMAIATAAIFAVSIWRASRERPAVAVPAPSPVVAGPERRLTYWITVQKFREGKYKDPYTVAGEINFEAGDQVRLNVRTPEPGHLYILNEGPRGGETVPEFNILFPSPTANKGASLLAADQQIQIPEASWYQFDTQEGVERLWLVFSEDAVAELENVKQFANKKASGLIADMTQNKLVYDFLTSHSTVKPDVDKGETLTTLKASGKLLVYPVRLEHH